MKKILLFILLFCSFISSVYADSNSTSLSEWTMFGRTLDNNRYYPGTVNMTDFSLLWNFSTGGVVNSSPAIANNILYVGSYDNQVYALNASTGVKIWNFSTGNPISSSPAIDNGVVFVGSPYNHVYALNASTGVKIWNSSTYGSGYPNSPTVANGVVYVGAEYAVYALNASTGVKIWSFSQGLRKCHAPAVSNGVVYFIASENFQQSPYALNASTGTNIWNVTSFAGWSITPAIYKNKVYFGMSINNATTGANILNSTLPTTYSANAIANDLWFLQNQGGSILRLLNATTGLGIWNFPYSAGPVPSSPALSNGVVFFGGGNNIYAVNTSNGVKIWNYTTGGLVQSSPSIVNAVVYVGSVDGQVYAFKSNDTTTPDTTPPLINGTIVNLSITTNTDGSITLIWNNDTNPDVTMYNVYRSITGNFSTPVNDTDRVSSNITALTWIDTSVSASTTYYYVLTAVDAVGNENKSAITSIVNATTSGTCSNEYGSWGSWSSCSGSTQSRTRTRICYLSAGNTDSDTGTQKCSSGGGSSSRGSSGPLDFINIIRDSLSSDTIEELKVDNEEIGIEEILLHLKENVSKSTKITIKKIKSKPSDVDEPKSKEKVYKYIQIIKDFDDGIIEKAIIKFEVSITWLDENSIDKKEIRLMRFTSQWDELTTTIISEEDNLVYFEAETPGFSYFKISNVIKVEDKIVELQENKTKIENITTEEDISTFLEDEIVTVFTNKTDEDKIIKSSKRGIIYILILSISVIMAVTLILRRDKKYITKFFRK